MRDPRVMALAAAVAEQTKLIHGNMVDEHGGVCTIGAFGYASSSTVKAAVTRLRYYGDKMTAKERAWEVATVTDECQLVAYIYLGYDLIKKVQAVNDDLNFKHQSLEQRRDRVLVALQASDWSGQDAA